MKPYIRKDISLIKVKSSVCSVGSVIVLIIKCLSEMKTELLQNFTRTKQNKTELSILELSITIRQRIPSPSLNRGKGLTREARAHRSAYLLKFPEAATLADTPCTLEEFMSQHPKRTFTNLENLLS